ASCTRFSPNTHWPAATTGSMASGLKVFDTAIKVTSARSRCASRHARAISVRTCSRLFAAAAAMRWLYRTASCAATSNEGPRTSLANVAAGHGGQRRTIDHFKDAVFPANRLAHEEALERLVGVHQRHSQGVGEMLLGEGKLNGAVIDQPGLLRTHEKMQQQIGGTLECGTTAETDQMFVDELLLARREPRDVESQRRQATVKVPQLAAREYAQHQRRERFN